jgi:hypothetical protein
MKLFSDNATQRFFERFPCALNILAKDFVEHGLVVAAGAFDLVPEPCKDFVINSNGDAGLPAADGNHGSALGVAKIVFTFHGVPHSDSSRAPWRVVLKSTAFCL